MTITNLTFGFKEDIDLATSPFVNKNETSSRTEDAFLLSVDTDLLQTNEDYRSAFRSFWQDFRGHENSILGLDEEEKNQALVFDEVLWDEENYSESSWASVVALGLAGFTTKLSKTNSANVYQIDIEFPDTQLFTFYINYTKTDGLKVYCSDVEFVGWQGVDTIFSVQTEGPSVILFSNDKGQKIKVQMRENLLSSALDEVPYTFEVTENSLPLQIEQSQVSEKTKPLNSPDWTRGFRQIIQYEGYKVSFNLPGTEWLNLNTTDHFIVKLKESISIIDAENKNVAYEINVVRMSTFFYIFQISIPNTDVVLQVRSISSAHPIARNMYPDKSLTSVESVLRSTEIRRPPHRSFRTRTQDDGSYTDGHKGVRPALINPSNADELYDEFDARNQQYEGVDGVPSPSAEAPSIMPIEIIQRKADSTITPQKLCEEIFATLGALSKKYPNSSSLRDYLAAKLLDVSSIQGLLDSKNNLDLQKIKGEILPQLQKKLEENSELLKRLVWVKNKISEKIAASGVVGGLSTVDAAKNTLRVYDAERIAELNIDISNQENFISQLKNLIYHLDLFLTDNQSLRNFLIAQLLDVENIHSLIDEAKNLKWNALHNQLPAIVSNILKNPNAIERVQNVIRQIVVVWARQPDVLRSLTTTDATWQIQAHYAGLISDVPLNFEDEEKFSQSLKDIYGLLFKFYRTNKTARDTFIAELLQIKLSEYSNDKSAIDYVKIRNSIPDCARAILHTPDALEKVKVLMQRIVNEWAKNPAEFIVLSSEKIKNTYSIFYTAKLIELQFYQLHTEAFLARELDVAVEYLAKLLQFNQPLRNALIARVLNLETLSEYLDESGKLDLSKIRGAIPQIATIIAPHTDEVAKVRIVMQCIVKWASSPDNFLKMEVRDALKKIRDTQDSYVYSPSHVNVEVYTGWFKEFVNRTSYEPQDLKMQQVRLVQFLMTLPLSRNQLIHALAFIIDSRPDRELLWWSNPPRVTIDFEKLKKITRIILTIHEAQSFSIFETCSQAMLFAIYDQFDSDGIALLTKIPPDKIQSLFLKHNTASWGKYTITWGEFVYDCMKAGSLKRSDVAKPLKDVMDVYCQGLMNLNPLSQKFPEYKTNLPDFIETHFSEVPDQVRQSLKDCVSGEEYQRSNQDPNVEFKMHFWINLILRSQNFFKFNGQYGAVEIPNIQFMIAALYQNDFHLKFGNKIYNASIYFGEIRGHLERANIQLESQQFNDCCRSIKKWLDFKMNNTDAIMTRRVADTPNSYLSSLDSRQTALTRLAPLGRPEIAITPAPKPVQASPSDTTSHAVIALGAISQFTQDPQLATQIHEVLARVGMDLTNNGDAVHIFATLAHSGDFSVPALLGAVAVYTNFGENISNPQFWDYLKAMWSEIDWAPVRDLFHGLKSMGANLAVGISVGITFRLIADYLIKVVEEKNNVTFADYIKDILHLPDMTLSNFYGDTLVIFLSQKVVYNSYVVKYLPTFRSVLQWMFGTSSVIPGIPTWAQAWKLNYVMLPASVATQNVVQGIKARTTFDEEHPIATAVTEMTAPVIMPMGVMSLFGAGLNQGLGVASRATPILATGYALFEWGLPAMQDLWIEGVEADAKITAQARTFIERVIPLTISRLDGFEATQATFEDVKFWMDQNGSMSQAQAMLRFGNMALTYLEEYNRVFKPNEYEVPMPEGALRQWEKDEFVPGLIKILKSEAGWSGESEQVAFGVLTLMTLGSRLSRESVQAIEEAIGSLPNGKALEASLLNLLVRPEALKVAGL